MQRYVAVHDNMSTIVYPHINIHNYLFFYTVFIIICPHKICPCENSYKPVEILENCPNWIFFFLSLHESAFFWVLERDSLRNRSQLFIIFEIKIICFGFYFIIITIIEIIDFGFDFFLFQVWIRRIRRRQRRKKKKEKEVSIKKKKIKKVIQFN